MEAAQWFEAALTCEPKEFYRCLLGQVPEGAVLNYHHFYEPWHSRGPVCRLLLADEQAGDVFDLLRSWEAVERVGTWVREEDDRCLYGPYFDAAMDFFRGSSALAGASSDEDALVGKLIHCVLNAHAFGNRDERRWARKYFWGRHKLPFLLKLREWRTGKVWWAR